MIKTPIIKYSDKALKILSPFMGVKGITIFPYIILKEKYRNYEYLKDEAEVLINHETIHIHQQKELLVIPFYILYGLEWFIKLFKYGKDSYYNLSFEKEAFINQSNESYITKRKPYSFLKYM